ncbi:hypothetical protein ACFX1T_002914 [Malus domestica]
MIFDQFFARNNLQENNNLDSCVLEFNCCSSQSASSKPQLGATILSISLNDRKDNCIISMHIDSECSTTQDVASRTLN